MEKSVKMEGERKKVYTDEEVYAQIKDKSWQEFKMFNWKPRFYIKYIK